MTPEEQLVDLARWTARYLAHHPGCGSNDDIFLRRELQRVLFSYYEHIKPLHDDDRREWEKRHALVRA